MAAAWPYVYVADYHSGLRAVRVNTLPPVAAGSYDTAGLAYDVEVANNYAYVADWTALWVIDIGDPEHLSQAGAYDLPYGVIWAVDLTRLQDL